MLVTPNRLVAAVFVALLIAAACYSIERGLFADSAFMLFRIINLNSLQIQEHRYGSFITQCFPLMAARLHLPLKLIFVLYSISFNLFYLTVALLLLFTFRDYRLGVLMSFYYLLYASDTFYWMNNEVHQGIAWMFLLFAFVRMFGRKKTPLFISLPVFTVLAFLALYTHPLVIFPTAFLWLFFVRGKGWRYTRLQTVLFSAILVALAVSKLALSAGVTSHYDVEKLQGIRNVSWQRLIDGLKSPFTKTLLWRTLWNYCLPPVLFVAGVWKAWCEKRYRVVALTAVFSVAYFLALCLTFNDFLPFYTESELMPVTVIVTTPFVFYLLPRLKVENQAILLAAIFLFRFAFIHEASQKWVDRRDWVNKALDTMQKLNVNKAIIPVNQEISDTLQMTWGTPVESLLASAIRGDQPQRTFVVGDPKTLAGRIPTDNRVMVSSFDLLQNASLNPAYFRFDTTSGYRLVKIPTASDTIHKPALNRQK